MIFDNRRITIREVGDDVGISIRFKPSQEDINDDARLGRPSTSTKLFSIIVESLLGRWQMMLVYRLGSCQAKKISVTMLVLVARVHQQKDFG